MESLSCFVCSQDDKPTRLTLVTPSQYSKRLLSDLIGGFVYSHLSKCLIQNFHFRIDFGASSRLNISGMLQLLQEAEFL